MRGFEKAEYAERLARAQAALEREGLAALLLTCESDIRYFTGFLTRFWESPTRPWFLVVPASGAPVAVIPEIGAHLMAQVWDGAVRTWAAPDYSDDGVGLLAEVLGDMVGAGARVGVPFGMESHLHMPLAAWTDLQALLPDRAFGADAGVMRGLRLVKSAAEVAKIERACAIAGRAFTRVPEVARAGVPLSEVFRRFQMLCLEEGADWVPYLAGAADQGGYGDVISPATDVPLAAGDVLMLDTGLVWDGYFCDFDRNFSVGAPSEAVAGAHAQLIAATQAGFAAARAGVPVAELHRAMEDVLGRTSGRLGHGLGMQLTEGFSILPDDPTVLDVGMVLTLEPSLATGPGKMMVHEENIVIEPEGPRYLSRAASDLAVLA